MSAYMNYEQPGLLEKEALKRQVLGWANEMRAFAGMLPLAELPKGRPSKSQCVIARCFNEFGAAFTSYTQTVITKDDRVIGNLRHPAFVTKFIHYFDSAIFPELIDNSSYMVMASLQKPQAFVPMSKGSMIPSDVLKWFEPGKFAMLPTSGGGS